MGAKVAGIVRFAAVRGRAAQARDRAKKVGQATRIAPLRPPALASFRTWGIQRELVVRDLPRCEGKERWELVWGELGFFAGNDMYVHAYVYLGLMDEEVSPYSGCLLFMTNAFGRELLKKVQHFFERLGLNATEVFMLMSIVREPGITVGKLAKEVILDPSTVSRAVLQLERKGFVFRNTMGSRVEVLPTPEGRKKERDARAAWGKARDYYEGKFTAQRSTEWSGSLANALAYMYEEE